ncbi:hypothetical protein FHETE_4455 [Fusarium heterosporum]|uniref:Uncharacterized protein n=1 Tax=Fusarium heterosporum TaxID=42747 RepID=A0A8H5WUA3_FUSHE|nr:hypothetical protein FHETE_4455 [Fusarium heterosporum]
MSLLSPEPHHKNNEDNPPLEPSVSSILPHKARDLKDKDGNTWTAWSELGDGTVEHSETSTTDTSKSILPTTVTATMLPSMQGPIQEIDSSTTDEVDHTTATSTVTWTDSATLTFIDVSSSPQVSLSTVEWIGVTIGIISVFAAVSAVLLIFVLRRRRASRPAESQNNISIRLDNIPVAPLVSQWSRNTSSSSNIPRSNYTDSRELRTTFVPHRPGVIGPPPTYEGDQKYHTGEYQEQDIGIQEHAGEASGPGYEAYSSAVYNDPKRKGKQREEF